jgi:hypothetical protein
LKQLRKQLSNLYVCSALLLFHVWISTNHFYFHCIILINIIKFLDFFNFTVMIILQLEQLQLKWLRQLMKMKVDTVLSLRKLISSDHESQISVEGYVTASGTLY